MIRVYNIGVWFNDKLWLNIWIDTHYEKKHFRSINDDLILAILSSFESDFFVKDFAESNGFQYFEVDTVYESKPYRIILVIPPDHSYLGVRNTYRRSK